MDSKELDRLMAEKVMGWIFGNATADPSSEIVWWAEEEQPTAIVYGYNDWHPSGDDAQAIICLLKMEERGYDSNIHIRCGIVVCQIWKRGVRNWSEVPAASDKKLCLAIVEAIAKMIQQEETMDRG